MTAKEAVEDIAGKWLWTRNRGRKASEDLLGSVSRSVWLRCIQKKVEIRLERESHVRLCRPATNTRLRSLNLLAGSGQSLKDFEEEITRRKVVF